MSVDTYRVGKYSVVPCDPDPYDPRGFLWVWEQPNARASYVVGVDPVLGIAGWNRAIRSKDDANRDNAAIEVFRIGGTTPDIQVAEYAAPVDPYDLADIVNVIGRMYGGSHEDGQALVGIEVYPGQGIMTQRELISRYGYINLPPWRYEDTFLPKATSRLGWYSTRSSRQVLWARGLSHLQRKMAVLRSPWLVEEMADCTPDSFLAATGRARYGLHDDRVVACLLALWYANEWSMAFEPSENSPVETGTQPKWEASDLTVEKMYEAWEEQFSRLVDE